MVVAEEPAEPLAARMRPRTLDGFLGQAHLLGPGKALGEFSTIHEIDCRNPTELFVSEITDWRVQKIILHPQPVKSSGADAKR